MSEKVVCIALRDVTRELSGAGYKRVEVVMVPWVLSSGKHGGFENKDQISFPMAYACWGTATRFAIHGLNGGEALFSGELDAHVDIDNGDTAVFGIGKIRISVDFDMVAVTTKLSPPKDEPFGGAELEAKAEQARRSLEAARSIK